MIKVVLICIYMHRRCIQSKAIPLTLLRTDEAGFVHGTICVLLLI